MDRTLRPTSRLRGRLGLAALTACMLVSGQLLAMFGGPPRLPGSLPTPGRLAAVLTGVTAPVDSLAAVLVTCTWLLWFWIVGSLGLEMLVLAAEATARGTSWARSLRSLADRVTLPLCRRVVAAAFTVQILTRAVPVAVAAPLPAAEISRPVVSSPSPERHVPLDTGPTYRVDQGDTLWTIAEKVYGNGDVYHQLVDANVGRRMPDGELFTARGVIRPGWELVLPAIETHDGHLVYTVRPGDTLTSLARRLLDDEHRWREIFELNRDISAPDGRALTNPDLIWPGMRLRIPLAQPPTSVEPAAHTDEAPAPELASSAATTGPASAAPGGTPISHTPADADHRERDRVPEPRSMVTASIQPTTVALDVPAPQPQVSTPESTPQPVVLVLANAEQAAIPELELAETPVPELSDTPLPGPDASSPGMPLVIGGAAVAVAVGAAAALGVHRTRRWRPLPAEQESDIVVSGGYAEAELTDAFTHGLQGSTVDPAAALASQYRAFLDEYNLGHVELVSVAHGRSSSSLTVATPLGEQDLLLDLAPVFGARLEADVQASISADQDVVLRVIRHRKTRMLAAAGDGARTDSLLLPLGVLYNRQVLSAAWSSLGHVLVASRPGQGADTILTSLVATLAARCSPQRLKLWLLGKPRSLPGPIEELPHVERRIDPGEAADQNRLVDDLQAELEARAGAPAAPDLVLVLPELHDVTDAWPRLALLAGRALNERVHLLAATTSPESPIDPNLLAHFSTRLVLRLEEEEHSMALLGNADAAFLGGGGRVLLRLEDREPVEMYGYQVSDEHLEHLVRVMRTAYAPSVADSSLTDAPSEPHSEPCIDEPAPPGSDPDPRLGAEAEADDATEHSVDEPAVQVGTPASMSSTPASASTEPAAPVRVRCFGSPRVECLGTQLWPRRRAADARSWELMLYLACQPPAGAARERVVEALWPDDFEDEETVAHRLRQMRFRLRRVVGSVPGAPATDGILYHRGEGMLLLDPAVVYSDAQEFLAVVQAARSRVGFDTIPLLERARALYTGDLLDGPAVRKYAWLDERDDSGVTLREHFRRLFQQTTGSLADLYAAQGRNEEAIDVYRDLTELDPGEDRAWQQLFRLHALRKDRPALLREERRMRQMLRELATDEDGPTSPAMLEPGRETVREFNRALAQLDEQERGEAVIAS